MRGLFLTLLLALLAHSRAAAQGGHQQLPDPASEYGCRDCNVLLISIDTLRRDALGLYGNPRNTSPFLDQFSRESFIFDNAYSTAPTTAPSHMSMFTSLYPTQHGVVNFEPGVFQRLQPGVVTLGEELRKAGYVTAGSHDGGFMSKDFGFDKGFDTYEPTAFAGAITWLKTWHKEKKRKKFFLFTQIYLLHDPYLVPAEKVRTFTDPKYAGRIVGDKSEFDKLMDESQGYVPRHRLYWERVDPASSADRRHLRDLYETNVQIVDERFANVMNALGPALPSTLVIVLSDHGEQFGEHGEFLHDRLYEELLRVPLLVRHPKIRQKMRVARRVSLIGLAPAILNMLGLPIPEQFQGKSFMGPAGMPDQPIYAEHSPCVFFEHKNCESAAAIHGNTKLIMSGDATKCGALTPFAVFDLGADPHERTKGATNTGDIYQPLGRFCTAVQKAGAPFRPPKNFYEVPAPETLTEIKSLGYFN